MVLTMVYNTRDYCFFFILFCASSDILKTSEDHKVAQSEDAYSVQTLSLGLSKGVFCPLT
jgi:hypothetical protein